MDALPLDLMGRQRRLDRARRHGLSRPGTELIEVEDAVVRVRSVGRGEQTIVLVPDPPNVIEHYDHIVALLQRYVRVVCVELPGFGFSVPPRSFGFGIDDQASVVGPALRALGLRGAVWAASCLPAYVGLSIARRHQGLLAALVCGQAPSWDQELDWAHRLAAKGGLATPYLGQIMVHVLKRRIVGGWYSAAALPSYKAQFEQVALGVMRQGGGYPLASTFQASFGNVSADKPVDVPATFVWGTQDRTHRHSDPESCRFNARSSEVVIFRGSAHFPDLEESDRFVELVRERAGRL